ncbi:hypothetical protein SB780_09055 [Burkholderia sp. SIMBA_057]
MNTTDKSRADALTDEQIEQIAQNHRLDMPDDQSSIPALKAAIYEALDAALPVEKPAAAPTHKPSCASLNMLLLTSPPKPARCDCGAIASPAERPAAAPISSDREIRVAATQLVRDMMADLSRTIEERDQAEEVGTRLANTVGEFLGVDVGEWSNANSPILAAIEALESRSLSIAKDTMTIPDPTDDVLCACGWETWNSLGSYVDRGTATARYRTIAAFVLEGISSPRPIAQPHAAQTRGRND